MLDETCIFLNVPNVSLLILFLAFHSEMLILTPIGSNNAPREA